MGYAADGGGWILGWDTGRRCADCAPGHRESGVYLHARLHEKYILAVILETNRQDCCPDSSEGLGSGNRRALPPWAELNYSSAPMVPVSRTARPMLSRSVTWPWL